MHGQQGVWPFPDGAITMLMSLHAPRALVAFSSCGSVHGINPVHAHQALLLLLLQAACIRAPLGSQVFWKASPLSLVCTQVLSTLPCCCGCDGCVCCELALGPVAPFLPLILTPSPI